MPAWAAWEWALLHCCMVSCNSSDEMDSHGQNDASLQHCTLYDSCNGPFRLVPSPYSLDNRIALCDSV